MAVPAGLDPALGIRQEPGLGARPVGTGSRDRGCRPFAPLEMLPAGIHVPDHLPKDYQ